MIVTLFLSVFQSTLELMCNIIFQLNVMVDPQKDLHLISVY